MESGLDKTYESIPWEMKEKSRVDSDWGRRKEAYRQNHSNGSCF
jgi:hypothetical protein